MIRPLTRTGALPISLDEAKAYLNREGFTADDDLVTDLIRSAERHIEECTQYFLSAGTAVNYRMSWYNEGRCVPFNRAPMAVSSIEYKAKGETSYTTLGASYYDTDDSGRIPVLVYNPNMDLPDINMDVVKPVKINLSTGYTDGLIPYEFKQMLRYLVAKLYVHRDDPMAKETSVVERWIATHQLPTMGM